MKKFWIRLGWTKNWIRNKMLDCTKSWRKNEKCWVGKKLKKCWVGFDKNWTKINYGLEKMMSWVRLKQKKNIGLEKIKCE